MYISSCRVQGLRDLPLFEAGDLGRAVTVQGPGPGPTALGDALELAFAALDGTTLLKALDRWGLLGPRDKPKVIGSPFPEQVTWTDRLAARALLLEDGNRAVTVELAITLDPPLFGELRAQAARQPALVAALSRGPVVHLAVSALFATSYDALALTLQSVRVGDETFGGSGADRAPWIDRLLRRLVGRFHRHGPELATAELVMAAATSRDRFEAYERWHAALLGRGLDVRPARGPWDRPMLLVDGLPLRRCGEAVARLVAVETSVHLSGADVLWLESDDPAVSDAVTGEGSPLEQVWRVGAGGALVVGGPPTEDPQPPLDLRRL